jgi:hypothetical protein
VNREAGRAEKGTEKTPISKVESNENTFRYREGHEVPEEKKNHADAD